MILVSSRAAPRIAVVLWTGSIGGAEIATLTLSRFLRAEGATVRPVFVGETGAIGERFEQSGFPVVSLGATPGWKVLLSPHRAAAIAREAGPDGAIIVSGGMLATALRVGGYSASLIAVEHGGMAQLDSMGIIGQLRTMANWSSGARRVDVFVGVSRFMVDLVRRHAPGCRAVHLPNGIDVSEFAPRGDRPDDSSHAALVVGCAGRLISGKGFEDAIDAAARAAAHVPLLLRIAGDGPLRETLASRSRVQSPRLAVEFTGWCESMPRFWTGCDIAIVPTFGLTEAFGMTALEAMACGVPVIASDSGALPEVVADGHCGWIYRAGDVSALSDALIRLAADPAGRRSMGGEARARVLRTFDAKLVARGYLDLFERIESHAIR